MNRREALKRALVIGGAAYAGGSLLSYVRCTPVTSDTSTLSVAQSNLLDAIVDTLIPDSKVPGAKAAGVGPFVAMMVQDCYEEDTRQNFIAGLSEIDQRAGGSFAALSAEAKSALLDNIKNNPGDSLHAFYKLVRELTFLGYFTSEIGSTQALRYVPVPGRYEVCAPYAEGDPAWTH